MPVELIQTGDFQQVTSLNNVSQNDVMGSFKSFQEELSRLMQEFADETSSLTINGVTFTAEQKNSPAVQLLLQDRLDEISNAQGSLLNILNTLFQLEKSASQIGSA